MRLARIRFISARAESEIIPMFDTENTLAACLLARANRNNNEWTRLNLTKDIFNDFIALFLQQS